MNTSHRRDSIIANKYRLVELLGEGGTGKTYRAERLSDSQPVGIGDSTFVGTLGYMPPEQLRGQTCFASDLYSLGVTLLFLLTKQSPDLLPQKRLKIYFHSQVKLSDKFANWLDKLIEPAVEERFQSVEDAMACLYDEYKFPKPTKSSILCY